MATTEQDRISRHNEALKKNTFVHNDLNKYIFNGWNTKRDGSGTSYTDEQVVAFRDTNNLYAQWKERNVLTRYENFTITCDDVAWDKQTTTVHWSVNVVKYYEGSNYVITTTAESDTDTSDSFSLNGVAYSEDATTSRKLTIRYVSKKYKNKDSSGNDVDIAATTTITLYGYTPIFSVEALIDDSRCDIECRDANNKKLTKTLISGNTYRFSGTTKTIKATAVPVSTYSFSYWKGIGIEGNSTLTVTLTGSTQNYNIILAKAKLKPIVENVVVGTWRKSWTYTTYTTYTACSWHWVWHWWGWWWGWWFWEPYWYTYQVPQYHTVYNDYYTATNVLTPYKITMPATGFLTMTGKYGVRAYGCTCTRKGGFHLYLNDTPEKEYQDTMANADKEFTYSDYVEKGDVLEIDEIFSTTLNHIAVWINKIEIDEDNVKLNVALIDMYDKVLNANDMSNVKWIFDNAKSENVKDHSIQVVSPCGMARDLNNLPSYSTTYEAAEQLIVKICMAGCHGYGYTKSLLIKDISESSTSSATEIFNDTGSPVLSNKQCYVYMPTNSKILIDACWHRVDTLHFGVTLDIKSVIIL